MLPSKTVPDVNKGKGRMLKPKTKVKTTTTTPKKKARTYSVEVEGIEDKDSARNTTISPTSSFQIANSMKVRYLPYYI